MIRDEEIKHAAIESGLSALHVRRNGQAYYLTQLGKGEIDRFARAIYNLAQQHQRESDAALCRDAAEKYLERSKSSNTHMRASISLACNAAAICLETAIRNNKEN